MATPLSDLIDRQVQQSVAMHLARAADAAGEELAHELLRDPAFKARMRELIDAAFTKALTTLGGETPKAEG